MSRFPDLAAYEKNLQAVAADPTTQAYLERVASLTRQPQKQELFEILVPATLENIKFVLGVRYYPHSDKGRELRSVLEARIKSNLSRSRGSCRT